MIALIPFVKNDYILAGIYAVLTIATLSVKKHKNDILFLVFGFVGLTISEYLFVSTGVETFIRNTLFGIMPFWLPFLWAYAFMVIGRSIKILDQDQKL